MTADLRRERDLLLVVCRHATQLIENEANFRAQAWAIVNNLRNAIAAYGEFAMATPAAAEPEPALREAAEAIASWMMAGDSDGQQVIVNVDAWDEWLRRRAALRAALGRSS